MYATYTPFPEFLRKAEQFAIPVYQRTHSWKAKQSGQFWEDILRTGKNDEILAHPTGSVVYIEESPHQVTGNLSPSLVIDG